jgi:hypothetical protein
VARFAWHVGLANVVGTHSKTLDDPNSSQYSTRYWSPLLFAGSCFGTTLLTATTFDKWSGFLATKIGDFTFCHVLLPSSIAYASELLSSYLGHLIEQTF